MKPGHTAHIRCNSYVIRPKTEPNLDAGLNHGTWPPTGLHRTVGARTCCHDGVGEANVSENCRQCGAETICISMERNGEDFAMQSCSNCDLRVWHVAGHSSPLNGVLDRLTGAVPVRPQPV